MTAKGVTVLRHENIKLPAEFIEKALAKYGTCLGIAFPGKKDGVNKILFRKENSKAKAEDIQKFLEHDAIKTRRVVIFFGGTPVTDAQDIQPYPVLKDANGNILIAAFLNGDFSQFEETGSAHPPEWFCVEKQIIPRIARAYKIGDQDLAKTMAELQDPLHANEWASLMIGPSGSITLFAADGTDATFAVEGETLTGEFEQGFWASDTLGLGEDEPAKVDDDLAKELGDDIPELVPNKTTIAAPPKPTGNSTKPSIAAPKPIANTTPVSPGPVADPNPAKSPPLTPDDIGNPDTVLSLMIPPNMDNARTIKWCAARMPQGWRPPQVISGLKVISCKRGDANNKFMQEYLNQNKLGGLKEAVKSGTGTAVASGTIQAPKPRLEMPKPKTTGEDPNKSPADQPEASKKDTSPHYVGQTLVVPGMAPVFSPEQKQILLEFVGTADFKAAYDAHGKIIAEPGGPDKFESMFQSFSKQFNDKITPTNIASWPPEKHLEWIKKASPEAVAVLQFWLGLELLKASKMLDDLTDPHLNPQPVKEPKVNPEVQPSQTQPAAQRGGGLRIAMPKKKAG